MKAVDPVPREKSTSAPVRLCILFQGLHRLLDGLSSHGAWLDPAVTPPSVAEKSSPLLSQLVIPSENLSTCCCNSLSIPSTLTCQVAQQRSEWTGGD